LDAYEVDYKSGEELNTLKKLSSETVISLKNIYKSFKITKKDTIKVLKNININDESSIESIKKGEFVMIRGPSGCGKTTLMNIIGTFDTPSKGTVVINNKEIKQSSDNFKSEIRLHYLGVVFQNYNLLNTLTVNENIRLPLEMAGKMETKDIDDKVEELLKAVGMLNRGNHLPAQLSGGQQQRA
jgi:putative ABC transport system ATP-binding protein